MQLTVRQAAAYFGVDDQTVRRWIAERDLPVHRANERLHLNAIEIWEWAIEHGVPVSRRLLDDARRKPEHVPPLSELLERGGVHRDIPAAAGAKGGVLAGVVAGLPLPPEVDRDFLLTVLEAREAMGSTGIGDGIAIPHVRNPIVLHVSRPMITLCFLEKPVEFGALDGKPVYVLFSLISPTVRAHLRMLSRLSFALSDAGFKQAIIDQASRDEILNQARRVEAALDQRAADNGSKQ